MDKERSIGTIFQTLYTRVIFTRPALSPSVLQLHTAVTFAGKRQSRIAGTTPQYYLELELRYRIVSKFWRDIKFLYMYMKTCSFPELQIMSVYCPLYEDHCLDGSIIDEL